MFLVFYKSKLQKKRLLNEDLYNNNIKDVIKPISKSIIRNY